ncbi:hypothetical protein CRG98_039174 [Punica granatum]|uniref:Uncharacterized protein n=1 Tax=Punica granatum TaxID=22663 RepID=A0A2I0I8V1_PUNGR|nr:hypothetical protein CRG98_039174 [Punica granatum]
MPLFAMIHRVRKHNTSPGRCSLKRAPDRVSVAWCGSGSSLQKSRLVGEFLIFLSSLPAKVIDSPVGENTMMVVPGVRDVLASVSILICEDSVGSSCADGLCRDANQETKCGIPYQDERKINSRLINVNGILILKIYMMHVCENANAHSLIHVTRYIALEIENTQVARRPTQWTVVEVRLEDGMEFLQNVWF